MGWLQATVLVVAMAMGVLLLPYDTMFTEGFERVNTTHLSQVGPLFLVAGALPGQMSQATIHSMVASHPIMLLLPVYTTRDSGRRYDSV
jgi:hypothetical protein